MATPFFFFRSPGAINTDQGGGIDPQAFLGDLFVAYRAIAVNSRAQAVERRPDAQQFQFGAADGGLGHGLLLHGVHSRKSSHLRLV